MSGAPRARCRELQDPRDRGVHGSAAGKRAAERASRPSSLRDQVTPGAFLYGSKKRLLPSETKFTRLSEEPGWPRARRLWVPAGTGPCADPRLPGAAREGARGPSLLTADPMPAPRPCPRDCHRPSSQVTLQPDPSVAGTADPRSCQGLCHPVKGLGAAYGPLRAGRKARSPLRKLFWNQAVCV